MCYCSCRTLHHSLKLFQIGQTHPDFQSLRTFEMTLWCCLGSHLSMTVVASLQNMLSRSRSLQVINGFEWPPQGRTFFLTVIASFSVAAVMYKFLLISSSTCYSPMELSQNTQSFLSSCSLFLSTTSYFFQERGNSFHLAYYFSAPHHTSSKKGKGSSFHLVWLRNSFLF